MVRSSAARVSSARSWLRRGAVGVGLCAGLALGGSALAQDGDEGPRRMDIRAINLRGADEAGPYIAAVALRSAVMAACFGELDPEKNPVAVEAFLTIGGKGKVRSLSLQSAQGFDPVVDTCVMDEINKARFPAAGKPVEMSFLLSMGPLPDEDGSESDEARRKRR